jgi:tryptophan-rich sensory protein
MKSFFTFILAILISFIPGAIGVLFTPITGHTDVWYNTLMNSSLTPAPIVFSIAWTVLYLLLGIALFFIWRNKNQRHNNTRTHAITASEWLFVAQMVLNALWSYVFFGLHMTTLALFVLFGLIIVSVYMAREFKTVSPTAYYLVWPYIAWLVFAFYLNGVISCMN